MTTPPQDTAGRSPSGAPPAVSAARRLLSPPGLVALTVLLVCVPLPLGGGAFPADAMSGLLVGVVAVRAWRDGLRVGPVVAVLLGAIVLVASIAALSGVNVAESLVAWARYLQLFALVPLAVVLGLRTRRDVTLVLHALVLAAIIEGVYCVVQVLTGMGATFQGENSRATGTFGGMDVIAASVILGLGVTVCVALAIPAAGRARLTYLALALGLLLPLGLTLSRGSWLSTGAALLLVLCFAGLRTFVATLVCVAAAVVVLVGGFMLGGDTVGERLLSIADSADSSDSSTNDRRALWSAAVGMWVDHPVDGVGLRQFPRYRDTYAPPVLSSGSTVGQAGPGGMESQQELLSPHNQYLLVLSEQGTLGFLPFAALLVVSTVTAWRATSRGPRHARGTGIAVVGLSVWQLVNFVYGDLGGATSLISAVIIGLALWYGLEQRAEPGDDSDVDPGARTAVVRIPR